MAALKFAVLCFAVLALFAGARAVKQERQENPLACSVCQLVIGFVEAQVTNNATVSKIIGVVNKVCTSLHVQDWCNKNVIPLIPEILNNITAKENPQIVCQQIKLCAPQVRHFRALANVKPEANPLACGLCQGVVNVVEQQVQGNWTVQKLDDAILRVCNRLKIGSWCQQNVIPKVPEVIALLLQRASPDKVCAKIKLCDPSPPAPAGVDEVDMGLGFDLKCSLCESVIGAARQAAADKTQAGISRALNNACGKIPFAKDICTSFLAPFITQIAQDIINGLDNHKVCMKVKLCK